MSEKVWASIANLAEFESMAAAAYATPFVAADGSICARVLVAEWSGETLTEEQAQAIIKAMPIQEPPEEDSGPPL
jgi:hypothetical protein